MGATVRLSSRTFVPEIVMFIGDFKGIFNTFFLDMRLVSEVFGFFVIMVLSQGKLYTLRFQCFSKIPFRKSVPIDTTLLKYCKNTITFRLISSTKDTQKS